MDGLVRRAMCAQEGSKLLTRRCQIDRPWSETVDVKKLRFVMCNWVGYSLDDCTLIVRVAGWRCGELRKVNAMQLAVRSIPCHHV